LPAKERTRQVSNGMGETGAHGIEPRRFGIWMLSVQDGLSPPAVMASPVPWTREIWGRACQLQQQLHRGGMMGINGLGIRFSSGFSFLCRCRGIHRIAKLLRRLEERDSFSRNIYLVA